MGERRGGAALHLSAWVVLVAPSDDFIMDSVIITASLASRHGCTSLMRAGNQRKSR